MSLRMIHHPTRVSDEDLDILIESLQEFADKNVYDPWLLSDGRIIQPLDILKELKELRHGKT